MLDITIIPIATLVIMLVAVSISFINTCVQPDGNVAGHVGKDRKVLVAIPD